MGQAQLLGRSRRQLRGLPLVETERPPERVAEREAELHQHGAGRDRTLRRVEYGLPDAGLFRPCELRLRRQVPFRSIGTLRRFVALRRQRPLGLLPLGIGRMAHLGGEILGADAQLVGQRQGALLVRLARQPAGVELLLHRNDLDRPAGLHLQRHGKGQLRLGVEPHQRRTYVGRRS